MELWSQKLRRSGYPAVIRHEVIRLACEKHDSMCKNDDSGKRLIHRPRIWQKKERRMAKEMKKINWPKNSPNQISAPLILDPVAGEMTSEIKKMFVKSLRM